MDMLKMIFVASAGAMLGGIAALLTAPQSGSETRRHLKTSALKNIDKVLERAERKLESAHEEAMLDEKPTAIFI